MYTYACRWDVSVPEKVYQVTKARTLESIQKCSTKSKVDERQGVTNTPLFNIEITKVINVLYITITITIITLDHSR